MADCPSVSVVVPVYNSEVTIAPLVDRLTAVLDEVTDRHEIILIDDGSRDSSWLKVTEAAASHPGCRGIRLMRNYGQHNALLAGIRAAQHDVIVTIDDDLQNPPEEIPKLLAGLGRGIEVVYGTPAAARHSVSRRLASRITKVVLQGAMGAKVATNISSYRAFRRPLAEAFANVQGPTVNLDVLLTWATTGFAAVPVQHDARAVGASNYSLRQLVRHALNMLTGFSTLPLRFATFMGFGLTVFGMGVLLFVLVRYVQTQGTVQGFAFLASIIAIFAGAQMLTLGILGEYFARMYDRTMDRPSYVIDRGATDTQSDS